METRTRTKAVKSDPVIVSDPPADWIDPMKDPDKANAEIAALITEASTAEIPVITLPADDLVNLPGGLLKDGKVTRTVLVKELNGSDEEALSRAAQSLNQFHFVDRLLKLGVLRIGEYPVSLTEKLLGELLIGDREQLILGIRKSTYGEDIEIDPWNCPSCGVKAKLTFTIDDIPSVKLDDPANKIEFDIELRKGRTAHVRLASGNDQITVYEDSELTMAERQSVLLEKCVEAITDSSGTVHTIAAFPSMIRTMGMVDRHKILDALSDGQPGPKYDQIKHKCAACGEDVNVAVGLGNLFLHI
jgi:hypothetical protein